MNLDIDNKTKADYIFLIMEYGDYFNRVKYNSMKNAPCFYGRCNTEEHTELCDKLTEVKNWFESLPGNVQAALLEL